MRDHQPSTRQLLLPRLVRRKRRPAENDGTKDQTEDNGGGGKIRQRPFFLLERRGWGDTEGGTGSQDLYLGKIKRWWWSLVR